MQSRAHLEAVHSSQRAIGFLVRNNLFVQKEIAMKILTCATLACNFLFVQAMPCAADEVVRTAQVAAIATLEDLVDTPQRLSGRIINRGNQRIEQVRLLVSYGWLWNDDRRTDDTSPGWTEVHTLPMSIEAGQSAMFSVDHEREPPARDDGKLMMTAKVIGVTQWAFVRP